MADSPWKRRRWDEVFHTASSNAVICLAIFFLHAWDEEVKINHLYVVKLIFSGAAAAAEGQARQIAESIKINTPTAKPQETTSFTLLKINHEIFSSNNGAFIV